MRRVFLGACMLACSLAAPALGQNLGPFRQFLAVEPYYTRLQLYRDPSRSPMGINGYGGRLWINLAQFVGESWVLPSTGGIAGFVSYFPERDNNDSTVWHFGAQHDLFFANRPFYGVMDPFLSIGVGAFRVKSATSRFTDLAVSPGAGLRIPIPNRLQLRADVRDAIVFESRPGASASADKIRKTKHNLEIQGAIGITF